MANQLYKLNEKSLVQLPLSHKWLPNAVQYEVYMGSVAYGVEGQSSDIDVYGWCVPPKAYVFPHTAGYIWGFGDKPPQFNSWEQHHIIDPSSQKEYDLKYYGIVEFFKLCLASSPNIIDSLFVPQRCVTHCTIIGEMVRENRKLFLSKKCWDTFKGYAYSQMSHLDQDKPTGKRKATIEKYGYDIKHGYHLVRLLNEIEQILSTGDLILDNNSPQLKSIRDGKWSKTEILDYAEDKARSLEIVYSKSELRVRPDVDAIKDLLIKCLYASFGDLKDSVQDPTEAERTIESISAILANYRTGKKL